jgi:site-specific recombinase XerD
LEAIMRIKDVLDAYLLQIEADGRSRHTIGQARRFVGLMARYFGDRGIGTLVPEDVARFLVSAVAMRTNEGRVKRPGSTNALRSTIRCFFGFALAAGYTSVDPARLVRRARCPAPQPRGLSDGEVERLVAVLAAASTVAERRDRALFMTLLGTGLRLGSAIGLDVGDVDLDEGVMRVRVLKNGGDDVVYVPRELIPLLREHLGSRTEGPLFPASHGGRLGARQLHRRLEWWGNRAGIEGLHPHRLRHVFAQRLFSSTGNVLLVARALCHRSVASSQVYVRVSEEMVRRAVGAQIDRHLAIIRCGRQSPIQVAAQARPRHVQSQGPPPRRPASG